jgi:adenylate cyclase
LKTPGFLERPVEQDVAVIFLDLSSFTGLAESVGAQWSRDLLSNFYATIERETTKHGGLVVNFMGDGAMILFGLPRPRPDDAARALRAVTDLHDETLAWLATLPPIARDRLSVRIGGHFGAAVVSRLGPEHHQQITAIGDTVNVASRLLEAAKQLRRHAIVSEDLFAAAGARGEATEAREVDIRGRAKPLKIRILR